MKFRNIAIVFGLLVAAPILVSVIHHYQLRAATNAYIATLKVQGEPMDLAQVLPARLSAEANSADTVRKAEVLIKSRGLLSTNCYSAMEMVAPGKAMICSRQPVARETDVTNTWTEVNAAVSENEDVFRLLRSLIEKPQFDFGIDYERGVGEITYSNLCLVECKHAAQRLQVAILSDLHRGDVASAIENERAILAIVKGMSDERLAISELVRMAIVHIAMASTWEILQSTNLPQNQLAALQNDWANLEFFRSEEHALEMERASGAISIKKWRSSDATMMDNLLSGENLSDSFALSATDRARLMSRVIRWRYWWSYSDELRALKGYQALLDAPRSASTNYALLDAREETFSKIYKLAITNTQSVSFFSDPMNSDLHCLLSSSITTLSGVFNRVIKVEVAKQLTTATIALERYRAQHASYPNTLAALAPQFLNEVPRDPIDGQSMRYRLNSDGSFLLYSIGDDGKDDGGDPTSLKATNAVQWQSGRDWVWPQPATPAEVQNYYNRPPK
jgi:hypothetical protein